MGPSRSAVLRVRFASWSSARSRLQIKEKHLEVPGYLFLAVS